MAQITDHAGHHEKHGCLPQAALVICRSFPQMAGAQSYRGQILRKKPPDSSRLCVPSPHSTETRPSVGHKAGSWRCSKQIFHILSAACSFGGVWSKLNPLVSISQFVLSSSWFLMPLCQAPDYQTLLAKKMETVDFTHYDFVRLAELVLTATS